MASLNNLPLNSYILDAAFSDYGNGLAFKQTYSLLSEVLDYQVAAYVKGDFLSNFLYILIIFKQQIPKDNLGKLFSNEHSKVLLCTKALITIDWKWLKSTQKLAGSPPSGEKLKGDEFWHVLNQHFL